MGLRELFSGVSISRVVLGVLAVPAALLALFVGGAAYRQVSMLRALDSDTRAYRALHALRRQIREYNLANGRLPADLSGFEAPELKLYSFKDDDRRMHSHRISGVELRPGAGLENFSVIFSTYVSGGRASGAAVLGDFNGYDPEKGRMADSAGTGFSWELEVPLAPGRHSFRIAVNGRDGPEETVDLNHAAAHPNAAAVFRGVPGDGGKWLYDPRTGLLAIGCSGRDTKSRGAWYTR